MPEGRDDLRTEVEGERKRDHPEQGDDQERQRASADLLERASQLGGCAKSDLGTPIVLETVLVLPQCDPPPSYDGAADWVTGT